MPQVTKESFVRALEGLVRKYEADRETYISSQYNETQTRTQFITPFLEALGWDVRNEASVPYHLCEVWEEKGETKGRPDYTLRINGQTKFFLEAKSPSDELPSADILQTKRYAWNSRDIFFAGVCDFEQFRFFDASLRPDEKRPYEGEAFHLIYKEYASNVDKLWELSRERVAAGSLDQFLRTDRKSLRQRIPLDKDFLDNLTEWRRELASAIYAQNHQLDAHALNDIVQRLLDRIIFIRIAEDRKVIEPRLLWDIADTWEETGGRRNIMDFLLDLFREINENFNGEIFKPHPCEEIKIESHVLAKIIRQLYPPKSNYLFDVVGVELLGSIYERYLGNTLRITAKRVHIEPKPEVRKAGGVYYTPKYIVDYIVKNTVGKIIEGKTPEEVEKIRILDPACGSGSFLIGAFQYLIDYHTAWYLEHPAPEQGAKSKKLGFMREVQIDPDGTHRLSVYRKVKILQNNLFGVDIDPQAVEVTMMSLYLKAIEGERSPLPPKQHLLPPLKYNIRRGNSLIGPDIEKEKPLAPEERERIKPFDWHSREDGFGDILKSGGFDAVIGNPPYGIPLSATEIGHLRAKYSQAEGFPDSYCLFMVQGLRLTRKGGMVSLIVPNTFCDLENCSPFRRWLLEDVTLTRIWQTGWAFRAAVVDTLVFVAENQTPDPDAQVSILIDGEQHVRSTKDFRANDLSKIDYRNLKGLTVLLKRVERVAAPLARIATINAGVKMYEKGKGDPPQTGKTLTQRPFSKTGAMPKGWRPLYRGENISRYHLTPAEEFVNYGPWLAAPRAAELFESPKILMRRTDFRLMACIDYESAICVNSCHVIKLKDGGAGLSYSYILGLLNSRLLQQAFGIKNPQMIEKVFAEIKVIYVARLPVRIINFSAPAEKAQHNRIVDLVDGMLQLSKKKHSDKLAPAELDRLEREIAATDAQIDDLVYELYAINAEDRKIIDESMHPKQG